MNITKIIWAVRGLLYKVNFKKIGWCSYFGKPIFICNSKRITIGNRCRIYPGMRAEIVDKCAELVIGDNVSIGQNFHVVAYKEKLEIGNNVTISGNVFISNCEHDYTQIGVHVLEQELVYKNTYIGDGSFIGYGAVIQAGSRIGKQCIIGANSVVKGVIPDYSVVVGAPAKIVKYYNVETKKWEKAE